MIYRLYRLAAHLLFGSLISMLLVCSALGQEDFNLPGGEIIEDVESLGELNFPFPFYNENFGAAVGYVYGKLGWPQKQASMLGTLMAGSKGSVMAFMIGKDLMLPKTEHAWMPQSDRLFIDPIASIGYFNNTRAYVPGNPEYSGQRPGSNGSSENNYVEGDGWDNFYRINFRYLLPMGHGKDTILPVFKFDKGLLVDGAAGGESWDPFESGRTYVEVRPFYRNMQIEGEHIDEDVSTNGISLGIYWDNRDNPQSPNKGNSLSLRLNQDFGILDSSSSWTNLNTEFDYYLPLGASESFRQRVLAFDFWTSYSPSWDVRDDGSVANGPPPYTGAALGGLWRMRGYPSQRFSDKAAIYYAAEYRMIPRWNPFDGWSWLQNYLGIQWIQLVPFAEIGRVAPEWNLRDMHEDMKWSAGLGVRFWAKGLVARIDTAASGEGGSVQMMISQPFQF